MPDLVQVTLPPRPDANDGALETNPPPIGNRRYGQVVLLSGATQNIPVNTGDVDWRDFETLTVSTTALQITEALRDFDRAWITVESAAVRYRVDGGAPTATVGHLLKVDSIHELMGKLEVEQFRVIADGADATLQITVGMRV